MSANEPIASAILGVIQGLTEFLPVSSSGHLVLFQEVLTTPGDPLLFDLAVHLGTLLPVLIVFRADLIEMITAPFSGEAPIMQRTGTKLIKLLLLGSIPTAVIGLTFQDQFKALFNSAGPLVFTFAITGALLFATKFAREGMKSAKDMSVAAAVAIGTIQGLAITPGISRSGSTIAAALFLGLNRQFAAKFSFLLSIPAIAGAILLEVKDADWSAVNIPVMALGAITAAVTGYIALKVLLKLVNSGDFSKFAWYCWFMALVALVTTMQ